MDLERNYNMLLEMNLELVSIVVWRIMFVRGNKIGKVKSLFITFVFTLFASSRSFTFFDISMTASFVGVDSR